MDEGTDYERDELIARFRQYLHDSEHKDFFGHDDIVEIFDYAGDMSDEYVRIEALMYAARYFPESKDMEQRRLIFYSGMYPQAASDFLRDHGGDAPDRPLLQRLIAIQEGFINDSDSDSDNAIAALERILAGNPKMDDEETIHFVDTAHHCDCLDWLEQNLERVADCSNNRACLLYELAMSLLEQYEYARAVPIIEKLVSEKPFILSYWELLLDAQINSHAEDADTDDTIETILAMDPENRQALKHKFLKIYHNDGNPDELSEIIRAIPDDGEISRLYIRSLVAHGRKDEAAAYINGRLQANPLDYEALVSNYFVVGHKPCLKAIKQAFMSQEAKEKVSPSDWYEAIKTLDTIKAAIAGYAIMLWILEEYSHNEIPEWWTSTLIVNAFNACKYNYVVNAIYADETFLHRCDMVQYTLVVCAFAKAGEYDIARDMCCNGIIYNGRFWPKIKDNSPHWTLLFYRCLEILSNIVEAIDDAREAKKTPIFSENPFDVHTPRDE